MHLEIDDKFFFDPRIQNLTVRMQDPDRAYGVMLRLYRLALEYFRKGELIPIETYEASFPNHILECGLVTKRENGYYVKGSNSYFEWINKKKYAGRLGGQRASITKRENIKAREGKNSGIPFDDIVNLFHSICKDLPVITKLSETRKIAVRKRHETLKDLEGWKSLFDKVHASDFLNRRKEDSDFKASFDWITIESNFLKILEGNYANKGEVKKVRTVDPNIKNLWVCSRCGRKNGLDVNVCECEKVTAEELENFEPSPALKNLTDMIGKKI